MFVLVLAAIVKMAKRGHPALSYIGPPVRAATNYRVQAAALSEKASPLQKKTRMSADPCEPTSHRAAGNASHTFLSWLHRTGSHAELLHVGGQAPDLFFPQILVFIYKWVRNSPGDFHASSVPGNQHECWCWSWDRTGLFGCPPWYSKWHLVNCCHSTGI